MESFQRNAKGLFCVALFCIMRSYFQKFKKISPKYGTKSIMKTLF